MGDGESWGAYGVEDRVQKAQYHPEPFTFTQLN
jgi:hypothetical protein